MKKKIVLIVLAFMGIMAFSQSNGKVLNIRCWNEEFMKLVQEFYPGYNKSNDTIGDVKVNWSIIYNADNTYTNALDKALVNQSARPDENVDLFLVESDYALKYLDSRYTMPVSELGITDDDLQHQFKFVKQLGTSTDGKLKALTWQAYAGVFVYRRSIAKKVLGTDDPAKVQEMISTWDKFDSVAEKMKKKNYYMLSGWDDDFRVFSDNKKSPWLINRKINIDESLKAWVKQSKLYTDKRYNNKTGMWYPEWTEEMLEDGKVFGYFGPSWFVDFVIPRNDYYSRSADEDWAVCCGPASFYWGGSWICVAAGTDNADLIKDILLKLTCDEKVMTEIFYGAGDVVNNDAVLSKLSNDADYANSFLGGQNPFYYYLESAKAVDKSNVTVNDQIFNEIFTECMRDYIYGNVTEEEAYEEFYKRVLERFPLLRK